MEMQVLGRRAPKARPAKRPLLRHVSVNTGARPPAPPSLALCGQRRLHQATRAQSDLAGTRKPARSHAGIAMTSCSSAEHRGPGGCMTIHSQDSHTLWHLVAIWQPSKVLDARAGYVPAEAPGAMSYYTPRISYVQSAEALGLERTSLRNPVRHSPSW